MKRACSSEGHLDPLAHQVLVWRSSDVQSRLTQGQVPARPVIPERMP